VNMRLGPGGVRELHWHQQAEWAVVTDGTCRIQVLDAEGRSSVRDVKQGDLWYFPPGLPHALQGVGTSGAEFTLVFDNGRASEFNTLLLTEWMAHTPPEVLAENFNLPVSAFKNIPTDDLWIYQGPTPMSLEAAQAAVKSPLGEAEYEFTFNVNDMQPNKVTKGGSVKIVDSTNFKVSKTIAMAMVTVKPGGMRELHWHPNADEWQYYLAGQARMTVFNTGPKAQTADFRPGDIGVVKKSFGHYVQNTGDTDLVFLEIFKADKFEEVTLAQWLAGSAPDIVSSHLNMDPKLFANFKQRQVIVPT
jgi:oxalate decarboxylase